MTGKDFIMDEQRKKILDEVVKNEFPGFIQMLERNLDFNRWGFRRIFSGVGKYSPIVVYASDFCRVRFSWQIPDIRDETATIQIYYGRSHAPIDEDLITWNGQKCWCWHDVRKVLCFLDGVSPSEAASDQLGQPKIMEQFRNSSIRKGWTQPEYLAKMHATIWEHYGQGLFDLFDLRQPFLWEQYDRFVAEYQRFDPGFSSSRFPNQDKVC